MLKRVHSYMHQEYRGMGYFLDNEDDLIESVAFIFVCVIYVLVYIVLMLLLFVSCPIWILPYLIYKRKNSGGNE